MLLKRALHQLIVIIPFIIYLSLTLPTLDWGLPNTSHLVSYHPDEGAILFALGNINPAAFDFNPNFFNHPSLYIYAVGGASAIADILGFVDLSHSKSYYKNHPQDLADIYLIGRLVTILFGLLTIYITYKTGALFTKTTGFFASLFLAIFPAFIVHSQYMMVDIPLTFFSATSIFFFLRYLMSKRFLEIVYASIMVGLATSTKYPGFILILPLLILTALPIKQPPSQLFKRVIIVGAVTLFAFFLATPYAILSFTDFKNALLFEFTQKTGAASGYLEWRDAGNPLLFHLTDSLRFHLGVLIWFLFLITLPIYLFYTYKERDPRHTTLILLFLLFLTLFGAVFQVYFDRYLLPALPIIGIILAIVIVYTFSQLSLKFPKLQIFLILAVLLFTTYTVFESFTYTHQYVTKDNRLNAEMWIQQNIPLNASIGVAADRHIYIYPGSIRDQYYNHSKKYRLVFVNTPLDISSANASFFIIDSHIFRTYTYPDLNNSAWGHSLVAAGFVVRKHFSNILPLLTFQLSTSFEPHDWLYNPDIYILEKDGEINHA